MALLGSFAEVTPSLQPCRLRICDMPNRRPRDDPSWPVLFTLVALATMVALTVVAFAHLYSAKTNRRVPKSAHAATGWRQYSWCRPPSTGLATTRWPSRIRWPLDGGASQSWAGAGMPGPRLACGRPRL